MLRMIVKSKEIRESFLNFFKNNGHFIEKSAPLIPENDPTLLFVNAGMVPFKNVFTQKELRAYKTAATSQKCIRAGGKHNDLENVGKTTRHHTFFEMLGNFSFGDYFKEKAIVFAWDFLTKELKLAPDRLSVSIFKGDDQVPKDVEAYKIWHKIIGLSPNKIKELGRKDNFWQMGDIGPCGPCSEIHFDKSDIPLGFGGNEADEKNLEIWNLVFMQFEMLPNGSLIALPKPSVDTGMGLERITSVINGLPSNYDTDLFLPLISKTCELSKKKYMGSDSQDDISLRVIADHSRATSFLIADGLFPSNEGRGYVLRRIMRRAIRYGSYLGLNEPFFYKICLSLTDLMQDIYPELIDARSVIEKIVFQEEEAFRRTLDKGLLLFEEETKKLKPKSYISGKTVFKLHDTYGFPVDLTENLALEKGFFIDWDSFNKAKEEHEMLSGSTLGLKGVDEIFFELAKDLPKTQFIEQDKDESFLANILAFIEEKNLVIFDKTPFYAESGGQVGDTGVIFAKDLEAHVLNTKKIAGLYVHEIEIIKGILSKGQKVSLKIDWPRRKAIKRNHSATHLLHSALRTTLGTHVTQKGSLVAPDRLRFDFSHFESLSLNQIEQIENLVNLWILDNEEAKISIMTQEEAKKHGALALFGEKYADNVRVLSLGSHSTELCGGTHVARTGDIGLFKIISEGPLALGIRRIEAITGMSFLTKTQEEEKLLKTLSNQLSCQINEIAQKIAQIKEDFKNQEKVLKSFELNILKENAQKAVHNAQMIDDIAVIIEEVKNISEAKDLRPYADLIRDKLKKGIIVLGLKLPSSAVILVAATKNILDKFSANDLVFKLAPLIGGKGGGKPDFAQTGGSNLSGLKDALSQAFLLIKNNLS